MAGTVEVGNDTLFVDQAIISMTLAGFPTLYLPVGILLKSHSSILVSALNPKGKDWSIYSQYWAHTQEQDQIKAKKQMSKCIIDILVR